jgi:hypothetical protein
MRLTVATAVSAAAFPLPVSKPGAGQPGSVISGYLYTRKAILVAARCSVCGLRQTRAHHGLEVTWALFRHWLLLFCAKPRSAVPGSKKWLTTSPAKPSSESEQHLQQSHCPAKRCQHQRKGRQLDLPSKRGDCEDFAILKKAALSLGCRPRHCC